jgi:hypothetical protein
MDCEIRLQALEGWPSRKMEELKRTEIKTMKEVLPGA